MLAAEVLEVGLVYARTFEGKGGVGKVKRGTNSGDDILMVCEVGFAVFAAVDLVAV